MFVHRLNLMSIVDEIRKKRVCGYVGFTCDCKYGAKHISDPLYEDNGCPELMLVTNMLYKMTDDEYLNIYSRMCDTP